MSPPMLSRAIKTILVLTGSNALKVEVHWWTWEATSVFDNRDVIQCHSPAEPHFWAHFPLAKPPLSRFLPVSYCGSVQDLHYFPHANRETEVGHQVKHPKTIVPCQGCKGRLSQEFILSISSSRNLSWLGKIMCSSLGRLPFLAIAFLQRDEVQV